MLPKVQALEEMALIGYNVKYGVETVDSQLFLRTAEDHFHADARRTRPPLSEAWTL
jgi:hypothetical protein